MRNGLSATALAELEIGSGQDHNARQERHAAHEPVSWIVCTGIAAVVITATIFLGFLFGPISFNPFVR